MLTNSAPRRALGTGSHIRLLCVKRGQRLILFAFGHLKVVKGKAELSRHFRDQVLAESVPQYDQR